MVEEPAKNTLSASQRHAVLLEIVGKRVANGWRIESQSEFEVAIVKGHRINHVLHLILSIITLGIWLIVWAALGAMGGERRQVLMVDEAGTVHVYGSLD